jgi:DNA polymerase-3 subunit epsilon
MNDTTWCDGPLLGFDTETTGVAHANDRIVQAALVADGLGRDWLIDPGVPIPPGASRVHGITDAMVRRDGVDPVSALGEVAAALAEAADGGVPVVAFRAGFDLTMLWFELERHGVGQPPWERLAVIDPSVLDKRVDRFRKGKRRLEDVTRHYGVVLEDAHSAAGDATATVALAREIGRRFPEVGGLSPRELHDAQVAWFAEDAASLEAYFRRKGRDEAVERRWPLAR